MLLSEIVGKNVYSGKALRGICRGVCLSLKSRAVKYLLCSREPAQNDYTEFSVGVSCIGDVDDCVRLKRLRTAIPKNCVRFFTGRPVYSEEGMYLGVTADLVMENFTAMKLITDTGKTYSAASIAALGDAVILKKGPVFPLGAKVNSDIPAKPDKIPAGTLITRGTLRANRVRTTDSPHPRRLARPRRKMLYTVLIKNILQSSLKWRKGNRSNPLFLLL